MKAVYITLLSSFLVLDSLSEQLSSQEEQMDDDDDFGPWTCEASITSKCSGGQKSRCWDGCKCCENNVLETPCNHGHHYEIDGICDDCNSGTYLGPNTCACKSENFGTCCDDDCLMPKYCEYQSCTTLENVVCLQCHNYTASDQAYYINDKGRCLSKCNWLGHWCFPGTCDEDEDYLHTTCQCTEGFTLIKPDKETTKCLLQEKPDILTCRSAAESKDGEIATTPFLSNSTDCNNMGDGFVNFVPTHLSFEYASILELPKAPPKDDDKHNYVKGSAFGIVESRVDIIKYHAIGSRETVTTVDLPNGQSNCSVEDINRETPSQSLVTCKFKDEYNTLELHDGEKVCHKFVTIASGYVEIEDMITGKTKRHDEYGDTIAEEEKCFITDLTSPDHCSNTVDPCDDEVLHFGPRIRRGNSLFVRFDGWFDPEPTSVVANASGIKEYEIEIRDVFYTPMELYADFQSIETYVSNRKALNLMLPNRSEPSMYAIYIWALDSTQESPNYRIARRFVLTDNTSYVTTTEEHPISVTSASSATNLNWQTKISPVKLDWTKHFFNSWHVSSNLLLPIRADGNSSLTGVFEQETGELPVSGTPNIDGITNFMYRYSRISEEGNFISRSVFKNVPNASMEALTISEFLPIDGDRIVVYIKAVDIMNNTLDDMVTVKIDSSQPLIKDMYLTKDGYRQLFVHNSTDLSEMNMTFAAYDPHSGLKTVFWKLGTDAGKSDIGNEVLPVVEIDTNEGCTDHCYCPVIGKCQHLSYVIPLDGLITNNTHSGDHNREYHFTFTVMNEAHLETQDSVTILIDSSPPEPGHVFDGPPGSKDRDFQSDPTMYWHWDGFIDHESGISKYHIAVGQRCFEKEELQYLHANPNNHNEIDYFSVCHGQFAKVDATSPGFYRITVIAFNGAMEPSDAVCSTGIIYDITPPVTHNITLIDSVHQSSILCSENGIWYIDQFGILKELSLTNNCLERCGNITVYREEKFPKYHLENGSLLKPYSVYESNKLCKLFDLYSEEKPLFLRSDNIHLTWNVFDPETQIYDSFIGLASSPQAIERPDIKQFISTHNKTDYKCVHCGLEQGQLFFISHKVMNKASLSDIVFIGPVIIDTTPPRYNEGIQVLITENDLVLSWNLESFTDEDYDDILHQYQWALGTENNIQEVTTWTSKIFPYNHTETEEYFQITYPKHLLQLHDQDQGKLYKFAVKAFNRGLLYTVAWSDQFQIHSKVLPTSGMVIHVDPNDTDGDEIGFQEDNNQICVKWFGFEHYAQKLNFSVGVGTEPNTDSVVRISEVDETKSVCINYTHFSSKHMYYVIVKGCNEQGCSNTTSKGIYIAKEDDILSESSLNIASDCPKKFEYSHSNFNLSFSNKIEFAFSINPSSQPYMTARVCLGGSDINQKNAIKVIHDNKTLPIYTWNIMHDKVLLFYNFIPLTTNFTIFITPELNISIQEVAVHGCRENHQMISTPNIYLEWYLTYPHVQYVTNYEVILNYRYHKKEIKISSGVHSKLPITIPIEKDSPYTLSVTPCYQMTCISHNLSQNFVIDSYGPINGQISSFLFQDEEQGLVDNHLFTLVSEWEVFKQKDVLGWKSLDVYDWTIAQNAQGIGPLLTWRRILVNDTKVAKLSERIYLHVYKFKTIYFILRVVGTSGIPVIRSSMIELQDFGPNSGVQVFDLPPDYNLDILKDYLHSANLGKLNAELHNNDVDFTKDETAISAAILGCNCGKYTWTLQLDSTLKCAGRNIDDTNCTAVKETTENVVKFTRQSFTYAKNYTICVTSSGNCASFSACSNGFIADTKPPSAGKVTLGQGGSLYSFDSVSVYLQWNGFGDIEMDAALPYAHGITNYQAALGTAPGQVDIVDFTNLSTSNHALFTNLALTPGRMYYAAVKGCDYVNHCTTGISNGLLVDDSPPVIDKVQLIQTTAGFGDKPTVIVSWNTIDDPDTGLVEVEVALGTTPYGQDIQHYRKADNNFLVNTDKLIDGQIYYAHVKATNRVGLWTIGTSEPILYDSTPPHTGYVRHGLTNETSYTYTTTDDHIKCHWGGFSDSHTGIFYYRIAVGTSPNGADLVNWKDVSKKKDFQQDDVHLKHGVPYYITVEACNGVLLCSSSVSAALTADKSKPIQGMVHIGHSEEHQPYQYNWHTLSIKWFAFHDAESGIDHYEWCINTLNGSCDITPMGTAHTATHILPTDLNLPINTKLVVTVVAYNKAGLMTVGHSKVFSIDPTSPTVISKPQLTTYSSLTPNTQFDRSYVSLKWEMFDNESPMISHSISILSHHDGVTPLADYVLGNINNVTIPLTLDQQLKDGNIYTIQVTGCNAAALCNSSVAEEFLVDSSPPLLGGFKEPMFWRKEGQNTTLDISWEGFADPHSSIAKYYLLFSSQFNGSDLSDGIRSVDHDKNMEVQQKEFVLEGKDIPVDELIFLTIWAENGVGLLTDAAKVSVFVLSQEKSDGKTKHGRLDIQKHSCDIHYCNNDCTCAIVGGYCTQNGGSDTCVERNVTMPDQLKVMDGLYNNTQTIVSPSSVCLQGYWTSNFTPNDISRFTWSVSMTGKEPGLGVIDVLNDKYVFDVDLYDRAIYCTKGNFTLMPGKSYGYHVGAWHDFDEYSHFTSNGVMIDTTPPTIGIGRHVLDLDSNLKFEIDFTSDVSGVYASWKNVFSVVESDIKNYIVSIGTSQGGSDLFGPMDMGLVTNISYAYTELLPGFKYYTTVVAVNTLGMVNVAYSSGFIVDIENPNDGVVFTSTSFKDHRYKNDKSFSVSWNGFTDRSSYIKEYQYSIAKHGTPLRNIEFVSIYLQNQVKITESLDHNQEYRIYVKAIDAAGHESNVIQSSSLIIDKTPPVLFQCLNNEFIFSDVMNCSCTTVTEYHKLKHCICQVGTNVTTEAGEMYKVMLQVKQDPEDIMAKLEFMEQTDWVFFQRKQSNLYIYEGYYVAKDDNNITPVIYLNQPLQNTITLNVFRCEQPMDYCKNCNKNVIQLDRNTIRVIVPAYDPESGIKDIQVGIGTNVGGFQLKPFTHYGNGMSFVFKHKLQHKMLVHVQTIVENNAGSRINNTLAPLFIDWTAPVINNLKVLTASKGSNILINTQWEVTEVESSLADCLWAVGSKPDTDDVLEWQETEDTSNSKAVLRSLQQGDVIYVLVKCYNVLNLHSKSVSEPITIVLNSPASNNANITIYPQSATFYDPRDATQSSDSVLDFTYSGFDDSAGISYYEYQLIEDSEWINATKLDFLSLDNVYLEPGQSNISVRAVNNEGLKSDPVQASIIINKIIPQLTGKAIAWQHQEHTLTLDWIGVFSWENQHGALVYEITVGTAEGASDLQKAYETKHTEMSITSNKLTSPITCYCIVRAITPSGEYKTYYQNINI